MRNAVSNKLFLVTALYALSAGAGLAERVTLKTLDNSFSVEGEITSFDGSIYTLSTSIGEISVASAIVVCEGAGCPSNKEESESAKFVIAGDRTLGLRLYPALLRDFSSSQGASTKTLQADASQLVLKFDGGEMPEDAEVTILPTASSDGLDALFKGETQLALSTRAVQERQAQAFEEFGLGQLRDISQETIIALDALVFVNHPDNPVRAVSIDQLARIFSGEITNWSDLGGRDADINLYVREEEAHAYDAFNGMVMQPTGNVLSANASVFTADNAISNAVQNDQDGIGFTSFTGVGDAQGMSLRDECGFQSQPTEFSIKTEEYPLALPLFMYQTNAQLPSKAREFREYVLGEQAQSLVTEAGFVDQTVSIESVNTQGLRIASTVLANRDSDSIEQMLDMVVLFAAADRLSTTFRFEGADAQLTARSQADISRLAEVLATDRFANKEVIFVGFTDPSGAEELNRQLSQQRAEQVLTTVLSENPSLASNVRMLAVGFGEISPLGCSDTDAGRKLNRRVEVWVRDIEE